jgi:hypothetical protein
MTAPPIIDEPDPIEPEAEEELLPVESSATDEVPTVFGLPLNRLVAFAGPYIAIISGALADWLIVHVHLLGSFHVGNRPLANAIAQVSVFGLTALIVWLGHQKWLDGYQQWAYRNAPAAQPVVDALHLPIDLSVLEASQPPRGQYAPITEQDALDTIDRGEPMPEGAIGGKPEPQV